MAGYLPTAVVHIRSKRIRHGWVLFLVPGYWKGMGARIYLQYKVEALEMGQRLAARPSGKPHARHANI